MKKTIKVVVTAVASMLVFFKKFSTIALIMFFSQTTFGQNTETEEFINQVRHKIVPEDFRYYNLIDSSFVVQFDEFTLIIEKDNFNKLEKDFPDFTLENFIQKSKASIKLDWRNYNLQKARIYSYDSIPKFYSYSRYTIFVPYNIKKQQLDSLNKAKNHNQIYVRARTYWSRKKIEKKQTKAWRVYEKSVKYEDKTYFRFSTPIILGYYAIVSLNTSSGGATYVFKKTDGIWKQILIYNVWAS